MSGRTIKRPDGKAMQRVLQRERGTLGEIVLRLAWQAGLTREEMHRLQWQHIRLQEQQITLPDRTIPLMEELATCLNPRAARYDSYSDFVVVGNRDRGPLAPQSISRLARIALDGEPALQSISLKDLRHDYIIRQLSRHPWPYVARISGMAATTMYAMFSAYMQDEAHEEAPAQEPQQANDLFVRDLVQKEGPTPLGLSLWLAWEHGLDGTEILSLTWEQVDVSAGLLRLPDREVEMDALLRGWLEDLRTKRKPHDAPQVLLTPRSGRPYDASRLSKVVRSGLIRYGLEDMTFQDFLHAARRHAADSRLLAYLRQHGAVTRGEAAAQLQITPAAAYGQLRRLTESGTLVRVGGRYYLQGEVVSPEEQYGAIKTYLESIGLAYLQVLADLLKIERRSCARILRGFVEEGKLARKGQMYVLPASGSEDKKV